MKPTKKIQEHLYANVNKGKI